ncbi:MAG: EcsC family protein [Candidatus Eremiobacteraeota bacterium]|nr:EcsC family protein [Candidatus Eremiobacteraeota bacterium]
MAYICPDCGTETEEPDSGHQCLQAGALEKAATYVMRQLSEDIEQVETWVEQKRRKHPDAQAQALALMAIKYASRWSGRSGFVTGLGDFLGPAGFAGGTTVDILFAAKLSIQMAQRIYIIYGHDLRDDSVKLRIMEVLGGGSALAGKAAGQGASRVGRRLTRKYITGSLLAAIKAFFRKLGMVFTQKGLLAAMPLVGSGVNMYVNKRLMNNLGRQVLEDVLIELTNLEAEVEQGVAVK